MKNQEQKKQGVTRFSVSNDDRRVLMGIDRDEVFESGVVYEAVKVAGEIILRPIGKYALPEKNSYPCELSTNGAIMDSGLHIITKYEKKQLDDFYKNR